jgi:hypothetical protein
VVAGLPVRLPSKREEGSALNAIPSDCGSNKYRLNSSPAEHCSCAAPGPYYDVFVLFLCDELFDRDVRWLKKNVIEGLASRGK